MNTTIVLEDKLTITDMTQMFGVGTMTIWNWRSKDTGGLPSLEVQGDKRPVIRFDPAATIKWADANNKNIVDASPLKRVGFDLKEHRKTLSKG